MSWAGQRNGAPPMKCSPSVVCSCSITPDTTAEVAVLVFVLRKMLNSCPPPAPAAHEARFQLNWNMAHNES